MAAKIALTINDMSKLFCIFFFAAVCLSCSTQSNWQLSAIPTGQKEFDSARLSYSTADHLAGMNLEFFCVNGIVAAYLSTSGRRISAEDMAKAVIEFKSETIEIPLALHEGRMRVRLPDELARKTALALQEGEPVTIMFGSNMQTFQPEQFSTLFQKLTKKTNNIFDYFQGSVP